MDIPDIKWLRREFRKKKIGQLRASELEIYLAYMLMSANGDLDKDAYTLADKYGYSDTKAARLKLEFSRRFRREKDEAALKRIFNSMIEPFAHDRIWLSIKDGVVAFSLRDENDIRVLRRKVENCGTVWMGDFNRKVVKLPAYSFAIVFGAVNEAFANRLNSYLAEHGGDSEIKRLYKTTGERIVQGLSTMTGKLLLKLAGPIGEGIQNFIDGYEK